MMLGLDVLGTWGIFWPGICRSVKASVASYSFIAQMLVSAPPSVAELRAQTGFSWPKRATDT